MTSQALERPSRRDAGALRRQLESLEREAGANALAVSVHDTESGEDFGLQPDRWFHAASTIKVAILLGVFGAFHRGALFPQSRVHVRNRFASAFDGQSFRVESDRDANSAVHESIGKTMRVAELAHHMIVTSSNLATNLLLDLVG
ncbi:MAG TPA: serine hydrolase, partial [Gemmatimonadaceae bacterium]|nr:serine hydrolase [Gemmatimonadaceae bacterium]